MLCYWDNMHIDEIITIVLLVLYIYFPKQCKPQLVNFNVFTLCLCVALCGQYQRMWDCAEGQQDARKHLPGPLPRRLRGDRPPACVRPPCFPLCLTCWLHISTFSLAPEILLHKIDYWWSSNPASKCLLASHCITVSWSLSSVQPTERINNFRKKNIFNIDFYFKSFHTLSFLHFPFPRSWTSCHPHVRGLAVLSIARPLPPPLSPW